MNTHKRISTRLKLAACVLIGALTTVPLPLNAADMSAGYSFTPTDRVTSTKLNNLVGLGTINTTFITDKTTAQPVSADSILFYSASASAFRKSSYSTLFLANTNLIVGQTQDYTPSTNDQILTWSAANNAFRKVNFLSLLTNVDEIGTRTNYTTPNQTTTYVLGYDSGAFFKLSISNLFWRWWSNMPFSTNSPTNFLLSAHTHPTNTDGLLIWDSVGGTNKATTLLGLFTNLVVQTSSTNTDLVPIMSTATNANNPFGTNTTISQISPSNMLAGFMRKYAPANFATPTAAGVTTLAHGLPGRPQFIRVILVETNAAGDSGWAQNDEVDAQSITAPASGGMAVVPGADATNITLGWQGGNWDIARKDTGAIVNPTKVNWNVKVYAYWTSW